MDIRHWPLDRIMQLPDSCFGRRFIISCSLSYTGPDNLFDISELAFPEQCVIWQLVVITTAGYDPDNSYRMALGDMLPAGTTEFNALEPLIPGLGLQGAEPRHIRLGAGSPLSFEQLRMPVHTMGRRLVVNFINVTSAQFGIIVGLVVSSIPMEISDCLLSAHQ